ncbi:histidine phosphatase family protein [Faecalicatena orotica]|uniref:Putative phosphoglycerate mutase n=1 Tax=Faecalicatena orotica TaxID=1544 RepID=A0A2Y9BN29_9FIRM|nr:histidine phosphatase family protein [Faecalicatena orotica]PWJ17067.1 putative phosphoglycerate mutase [Faecalicatena orotica]SSA58824.1 probable phosphoglycerate mutase [Faecalicatena orotica]
MKKIIAVLLTAVLSIGLFACSSAEEASESDTITMYIVRHGKTMFNKTDQMQGWSDTPLTEEGGKQADAVGAGMKDIKFIAAYSSDLGRQRATAKRILKQNKNDVPELEEIIGLREYGFGGYEGRPIHELWDPIYEAYGLKYDEEWSQYAELMEHLTVEDLQNEIAENDPTGTAETYEDITTRSQEAMDEIVKAATDKGGGNVLVVSSGSLIPTMLEVIAPGQVGEDISLDNCSVTIVEYKDGKYTVKVAGDMSYVEKGMEK